MDRARSDLNAGRPDLARDRITGYLYTLHRRGAYEEAPYVLLGEIYFAMKDLPRAGAAWMLTTYAGPERERADAAFNKRYGTDGVNVLKALKPRAPSELYPEPVRERLKSLGYRYRPYRPRSNPHALTEEQEVAPKTVRPVEMGCIFFMIILATLAALFLIRFLKIF